MGRKIHYRKLIVTHIWGNNPPNPETNDPGNNEYRAGNAYIIPDHYDHSLSTFKAMFREAKKHFPKLKETDCKCGTITKSAQYDAHPVIQFDCTPDLQIDEWANYFGPFPDGNPLT